MIKLKDIKEGDFIVLSRTIQFLFNGMLFEILCTSEPGAVFRYVVKGPDHTPITYLSDTGYDFEYAVFRYLEFHKINQ